MKRPRLSFLGLAGGLVLAGLGQGVSAQTIMGGASALFGGQQASFSFPSTPDRAVGFDFTQLPAGLTPLAVSETGTVVLRDDNNYYRWRAGELTTLAAYFSGNDITTLNDTTFWSKTGLTLGFDGTIAITNELWSHQRVEGTHETHDSVNQSLRIWPADGSAAVSRPAAGYTRIQYFTDDFPPPPQTLGTNQHLDPVFSSDGALWCLIYRGTRGRTAGGLSYQDLLQSLVRISPDGTVTTVRDFDGDSVGFRGVSDAGVPIGSWYDASGVRRQFVGDALADYEPQAISRGGQIIGYADGWWIYRPGQPPKAAPAEGFNFGWDTQDRLNGFIYLNYHTQPVAWLEDGPAGDWQAHPYTRLALPAGWSSLLQVPPGSTSPQVGLATNAQGTYPFLAMPNRLAVDANRDGEIHFATETIENSKVDVTSPDHPYRFWLNDDDDTELLPIPGQTIPLEQETAPAAAPDYSKHKIVSQRNLEDFARLWINLSGLQSILTAPSSTMQIGLKWQTGFTGTPAINIYLSADTTGSSSYLTSGAAAQTQLAGGFNNAIVDVNSKKTVDTTGTFIFPAGYWSSLTQANPTLHLLFEGAGAGAGQLILVLLDQNGNEIGTGPGVWFDLKNIKSMYQQFRATPATLPRPFDSTTGPYDSSQVSFEAYPGRPAFQQPANEEQKVLVFVNGSNETYEYSTSVAETVFKRLWWQGYKGRLVSFRWETLVGPFTGEIPAHYNLNEWLAWNWGKGLKDYLISSSAPSGYTVNVAAHSLGNTVVASALRLGMQASNVVLLQGAIPAGCFDTSGEINSFEDMLGREINRPTPDFAAALGYRGFVTNAGGATIHNFFNVQDYALSTGPLNAWEGNQELNKPDPLDILTSIVPNTAYDYDATTSGLAVTQRGRLFNTQSFSVARFVATPYESMSFIARSRSKALGAKENVKGVITHEVAIGPNTPTNLQNQRSDHSGEFTRPIQQLDAFYKEFIKDIGAAPIQ